MALRKLTTTRSITGDGFTATRAGDVITITLQGVAPDWRWTVPQGWRPGQAVRAAALAPTNSDLGARLCVYPSGVANLLGATDLAWGSITYIRA